uniref:Zinc finger protein ush n=1 Tax=Timema tahoe TaxID=61484 RepID=A0A7R9IBL5_9NEOP|nr:unnamed protein product [Timema tahoe]
MTKIEVRISVECIEGEDDEWGSDAEGSGDNGGEPPLSEAGAEDVSPSDKTQVTPPTTSAPSPNSDKEDPAPPPRLRLNHSLATDPALRVSVVKDTSPVLPSPAELEYLSSLPPTFHTVTLVALGSVRLYLEKAYPHLRGDEWKTIFEKNHLSTLDQDSDLDFPVIGSLVYRESSALDHAATEVALATFCLPPLPEVQVPPLSSSSSSSAAGTSRSKQETADNRQGRGDSDSDEGKSTSSIPSVTESNMQSRGAEDSLTSETGHENNNCKSARTGKQYACPHCSYSADKKVSLNRHMRMHSSSPAPSAHTPTISNGLSGGQGEIPPPEVAANMLNSPHLVDRYCQDCDIRFSSIKTFRAHKLHYCSTRHVVKGTPPTPTGLSVSKASSAVGSGPSSPVDVTSRTSPGSPPGTHDSSSVRNHHQTPQLPPQPFLALPTNPILIVPYSLFQGASLLTGPATLGLPSNDTACILLPNGTLQPMAQGLLSQPGALPAAPVKEESESAAQRRSAIVSLQSRESGSSNEQSKPVARLNRSSPRVVVDSSLPLDLSVRRSSEGGGDLVVDLDTDEEHDEEKENLCRRPSFSPEREDIVCAPSIPLMLSTTSTPSPPTTSPALSSSSLSNTKPGSSPRNGVIHSNSSHKKAISAAISHLASGQEPPSNLSQILLAAVAAAGHSEDNNGAMPLRSPLSLNYTSSKHSSKNNPHKSSTHLPPVIPSSLLLGGPHLATQSLLPLISPEIALRMASELPGQQGPQVLVKQGVSKCRECNIVFCKHENYVAHKKHYCSARMDSSGVGDEQGSKAPSPVAVAGSPSGSNSAGSPTHSGGKSSPTGSGGPGPQKPTLFQFICAACGIKFTSFDNLTAHQAYYCPKRVDVLAKTVEGGTEKANRKCPKCKVIYKTRLINHF